MPQLLGPDGNPILTPDGVYLETHYQGYGLGSIPVEPDARDWSALLSPGIAQQLHAGAPTAVPDLSEGKVLGLYDQDGEGACVAYSESGLTSLDEALNGRLWVWLDAEQFYHRNGGTGQNGIDTRSSLEDAKNNGIIRKDGQGVVRIENYLWVPKTPGLFKDTIMAALALGKPCVVATLLPTNFGWDSSGPPNPQAYHQVVIVGGDDTWAYILNSWGPNWGRQGRGRLLWSFLDVARWDVYAYLVNGIGVTPPPPPVGVVVKSVAPNPVVGPAPVTITGSGFDTSARVIWGGVQQPVLQTAPNQIVFQVGEVASDTAAPLSVKTATSEGLGPILTVKMKSSPPPPPPPPVNSRRLVGLATGGGLAGGGLATLSAGQKLTAEGTGFHGFVEIVSIDGSPPPPPPPGGITVTGYSKATVAPGEVFSVFGTGFQSSIVTATWGDFQFLARRVSDTEIAVTVPGVLASETRPLTIRVEASVADGPPLTVEVGGDGNGDGGGGGLGVSMALAPVGANYLNYWVVVTEDSPSDPPLLTAIVTVSWAGGSVTGSATLSAAPFAGHIRRPAAGTVLKAEATSGNKHGQSEKAAP